MKFSLAPSTLANKTQLAHCHLNYTKPKMTDRAGKPLYLLSIFVVILHHVIGGNDNPEGLEGSTLNTSVPFVYMADTSITVGETGLYSVPITIVRSSKNEPNEKSHNVYLELSYNDKRHAHLNSNNAFISAHSTSTTISLYVDDGSSLFFTQKSVYNVTIVSCNNGCDVGTPQSTIVTVIPDGNVTVWFEDDSLSEGECSCDDCCYHGIAIRSSKEFSDNIIIPLLTGLNDTATYNLDYSFDEQFVEAQPAVNLSTDTTYHYPVLYIRRDGLFEGTEYFHLRFDTKNLPDGVFVESTEVLSVEIHDDDYGSIDIKDNYRHVSEDVGTIELIVETNIIQPDKSLTLNVTINPNDYYGNAATQGADYTPFSGLYAIPPAANSTAVLITIINDDLAENEERINVVVKTYSEETGNLYATGSIIIEDDETRQTPLLFSFDRNSITANESSGTLEFYVTANIKNEGYVYVQNIPAEENGLLEYHDYTAFFNVRIKQELCQFNKDTKYKIEVDILNDCDVEMTEMMVLNISDVSIGQADPENYNLTIIVEDNDEEGDLDCLECSCGGGLWPTDKPTTEPEPELLVFNFELDEFEIYEGESSFYDIFVVATRPTNATVFIGIQPWELEYGEDFTISAKKLVFENNDRQNFSFRALQDAMDEDVESALINIAYTSDGRIGRWSTILVHVLNGSATTLANSRSSRSIDDSFLTETRSEEYGSTASTTGLVAGLVSSVLLIMVASILFGLVVAARKWKQSS